MKLILYRGIATDPLKADALITNVKRNGLSGTEGSWNFVIPDIIDVRKRIDQIFAKERPSKDDIFIETPFAGICACGDKNGARYYALKHNRSKERPASILITFEASLDDVYVDCRDFLCSAFQLWDRETTRLKEKQASFLQALYGDAINRYFSLF
jgi:hypothetical protein